MTRVCIATGVYFNPHETQIAFHLSNLFDGNTAVLFGDRREDDPLGKARHCWGETRDGKKVSPSPLHKLRGLWQHRTVRVPYGAQRQSIMNFLHDQKVDAVLSEFGTTAVRLAPVANAAGIPIFTYFRGADASRHLRDPFRPEAYRRMMPRLAGVFSVSQFLLDQLAQHDIRHHNAHVVPSGVDTSLFKPAEKRPQTFIAVGRLIEKKRPDISVAAFCQAARDIPDARFHLIGDGPLLEKCRAIADDNGMVSQVIFEGRQPHDVVRQRLATASVFLQHSVVGADGDTEGLPTAIQEAMACGLAIVSTRHAGIPEAVTEGENGYLVDENDADGFVAAIARCLAEPADVTEMALRNRAKAEARFDNVTLIKTVEREIEAVLSAKGAV